MALDNMTTVKWGVVEFAFRTTKGISRELVFAPNKTYLYTRHTFDFTCIFNPSQTSYELGPNGVPRLPNTREADGSIVNPRDLENAVMGGGPGRLPTLTDKAIRNYLQPARGDRSYLGPMKREPRKLIYKFGPHTLLETPAAGFDTDANNGPIVEKCDVVQTIGVRTFIIHMRIVACVNECNQNIPLLSHVWRRQVEYDGDGYASVATQGTAVFRSDVLRKLGTFPDKYRRDFMHPVADRQRREYIRITAEEDGVTYHYETMDKEVAYVIGSGINGVPNSGNPPDGPIRFDGQFSAGYTSLGMAEATLNFQIGQQKNELDLIGNIISSPLYTITHGLGFAQTSINNLFQASNSTIPKFWRELNIRCWGNAYSRKTAMINWALGLADGIMDLSNTAWSQSVSISVDLMHKFISINIRQEAPLGTAGLELNVPEPLLAERRGQAAALLYLQFDPAAPRNRNNPVAQETCFVPYHDRLLSRSDTFIPYSAVATGPFGAGTDAVPPGGYPTIGSAVVTDNPRAQAIPLVLGRGTFFADLIANALSEPCQLPPQVPGRPLPDERDDNKTPTVSTYIAAQAQTSPAGPSLYENNPTPVRWPLNQPPPKPYNDGTRTTF